MHPIGDPTFPKKTLTAASILLALSSFQFGRLVERVIWTNARPLDYVFLVICAVLFFGAIKMFRVALVAVPPDPKNLRLN
jgi:hypothetical protein